MATLKTRLYRNIYNIAGIVVILLGIFNCIKHQYSKETKRLVYMALCQSFFLVEIVNIAAGVSASTYIPTILQVSSRIFIIWAVCYLHGLNNVCVMIMYLTWGVSDLIRYMFYLLRMNWLKTVRYNAFLVLYPLGVCLEIYLTNCVYLLYNNFFSYIFSGAMLLYLVLFGYLYYHMLNQRRRSMKIMKTLKNKKKI